MNSQKYADILEDEGREAAEEYKKSCEEEEAYIDYLFLEPHERRLW